MKIVANGTTFLTESITNSPLQHQPFPCEGNQMHDCDGIIGQNIHNYDGNFDGNCPLTISIKALCRNINMSPPKLAKCLFLYWKFGKKIPLKSRNPSQNLSTFSVKMCSDGLQSITKFVENNYDGLLVRHEIRHSWFWQNGSKKFHLKFFWRTNSPAKFVRHKLWSIVKRSISTNEILTNLFPSQFPS